LILNVTSLPSASGKTDGVLLGLPVWNLWKDTTYSGQSWDLVLSSAVGLRVCPCLSHCSISISSSKSQNSSVSYYYLYI